jgi:hypothetical protein
MVKVLESKPTIARIAGISLLHVKTDLEKNQKNLKFACFDKRDEWFFSY